MLGKRSGTNIPKLSMKSVASNIKSRIAASKIWVK